MVPVHASINRKHEAQAEASEAVPMSAPHRTKACDQGLPILQQPCPAGFLTLPAASSAVEQRAPRFWFHPRMPEPPHADASRGTVPGDGRQPGRPEEGGGWGQQQRLWGSHLHRWVPAGRRQQLRGRWPQLHCRSVHYCSCAQRPLVCKLGFRGLAAPLGFRVLGVWGQGLWLWGPHLHHWIPAGRRQQLRGGWPGLHCRSVHGPLYQAPLSP